MASRRREALSSRYSSFSWSWRVTPSGRPRPRRVGQPQRHFFKQHGCGGHDVVDGDAVVQVVVPLVNHEHVGVQGVDQGVAHRQGVLKARPAKPAFTTSKWLNTVSVAGQNRKTNCQATRAEVAHPSTGLHGRDVRHLGVVIWPHNWAQGLCVPQQPSNPQPRPAGHLPAPHKLDHPSDAHNGHHNPHIEQGVGPMRWLSLNVTPSKTPARPTRGWQGFGVGFMPK